MTVVIREVVADGMETILKDGKVVEFMADVKQKDHAAWEKLKGWFKNLAKFLQKMVDAYKGQSAQTIEGAKVAEFSEDLLNQIKQIWAEGAVAAGENYQTAEVKENTTENDGVKMMARENTEIPYRQYRKLLNKKPLRDSKKYFPKVKDARIEQYRTLLEEDIPDIDFLEIAEYNRVDEGYVYTIRNYDRFNFAILGRRAIRTRYDGYVMEVASNGDTGETISTGNDDKGAQYKGHETGNRLLGDRGAFQGDAGRGQEAEGADQERSLGVGDSDSGRREVGNSHDASSSVAAVDVAADIKTGSAAPAILKSERTDDSISNRTLLANALEGVAQNDMERNRIAEYKEKIGQLDAQEKKLRELNAQIKEGVGAHGVRRGCGNDGAIQWICRIVDRNDRKGRFACGLGGCVLHFW